MGFKFVLTNEIRKASLIIGLKKHLKQNFKLINLAKQKNIPIYTLNQVSFYQVSKLIQFLLKLKIKLRVKLLLFKMLLIILKDVGRK
jgi:hypothetical protein